MKFGSETWNGEAYLGLGGEVFLQGPENMDGHTTVNASRGYLTRTKDHSEETRER